MHAWAFHQTGRIFVREDLCLMVASQYFISDNRDHRRAHQDDKADRHVDADQRRDNRN